MKRLLTSILLCGSIGAGAQAAFNTLDSININHINAMVLVHGDMWWNPTPGVSNSHCYFPNGTTKSISSTGAIWMSGYDAGGQLHTAAQTYRQHGNDYWPGPLDVTDTLTYATSQKWAKIWKVNRTDIQHFQHLVANGTASATTIPAVIWTWPAKGNANAQGAGGAPLTITSDMAPFVDANGDGIYQPLLGDYPDVKGDQTLWWAFSDNGPTHTETGGKPLKVEVHAMAYAYSRGTAVDNIVYYEYTIQNKSANTYNNFRAGQMADMDLGTFSDDYIGIDTARGFGYVYNGNNVDGQYGNSIPMAGIRMMGLRNSTSPLSGAGIGSFIYYNNDGSVIGNPSTAPDYDNYMRSKLRDGQHFTNDYTAPGTPSHGYGSGPNVNFVYSGNLHDTHAWTECNATNVVGDRRFVITSGDVTLSAGGTVTLTMMLVATNPDTTNACGDTALSLVGIDSLVDYGTGVYEGGVLPPLPDGISNVHTAPLMNVYPNPAHNELYIESADGNINATGITVYNTVGQPVPVAIGNSGKRCVADIALLPAGMYYVRYKNGDSCGIAKFMKK